ncbi:MAG: cation-translocating P-type ATPase, partial [Anaerolineae bacterium]|nr:cation-translocating P-type ATPase [Anaerolineae bacterium]
MAQLQTVQLPVKGMDCAGCTQTVYKAIEKLPGIHAVEVLLSTERATITLDPAQIDIATIRNAVTNAGYSVPLETTTEPIPTSNPFTKRVLTLFGIVFAIVLFVVVFGEWLGLFSTLTDRVPWPIGIAIVIVAGYPIFRNVIKAALRKQIISHTLMTLGVLAALAIGQWATAAVIVLFMRVGEYAEHFTTEKARQAVKGLTNLAPKTARVERDGQTIELSVEQLRIGDIVVVRPGEVIPVDGEVVSGHATINQSTITGESMPVDAGVGASVFAATIPTLGSLRIRTTRIGKETTFGRVITMVEEAESHRASVQRIADKVSAYYLPVVAGIALLTFIVRRDPLATAAVLVVACSCSFALATPIAMLATIGAAAKRGLLIKGGKYIEILAKADVLLLDKTGTLTLGKPQVTDVIAFTGLLETQVLALAASAEHYSEHPLAEAVRQAATDRNLVITEPDHFTSLPGIGIQAQINGQKVEVGSYRILGDQNLSSIPFELEQQGKTLLYVKIDGKPVGVLAASDTLRAEVPAALSAVKTQGMKHIELLTGDNERSASTLAAQLGISYRANLLPEDKIAIVKQYQSEGHTVVMIGDGVNDAPALAQANIGIAMGVVGTDIAIEAAHVALMREDWSLIPDVFAIAKRTMGVVRFNIGF